MSSALNALNVICPFDIRMEMLNMRLIYRPGDWKEKSK